MTRKNGDQTKVQNKGLEAKISKEETKILLMIDLGEIPLMLIRISLLDPTLHMGTTTRIMEDQMINAQINPSMETIKTDLGMELSTIRVGTGETKEILLVLQRLKGKISHKLIPTVKHEVVNLTTLPSADLTIDL